MQPFKCFLFSLIMDTGYEIQKSVLWKGSLPAPTPSPIPLGFQ